MTGFSQPGRGHRTAHIYCDESGGSDQANSTFLAAAVAIAPADAQRLIKSFRKATRITEEEVKGHRLTLEQRRIFFDLLVRQVDVFSTVVTCSRMDACGGWAMRTVREVDLYSYLLAEACTHLPHLAVARHLTVTPDGGRYKKAQLEPVREHVACAVAARHPHMRIHIAFGHSATLPGLQVADVIANSVFQAVGTTSFAEIARELLAPLVDGGALLIRPVQLEAVRPKWLVEV